MAEQKLVHLGCDTGEAPAGEGRLAELALLGHVTAVSIACGGHAGDEDSMHHAVLGAVEHGCLIGAHPSYPDRVGFGRRRIEIGLDDLRDSLVEQLRGFGRVAQRCGAKVSFIKPHGALYHAMAHDAAFARWCRACFESCLPGTALVGPIGSEAIAALREDGAEVMFEGFCDRVYEPDGSLRSRSVADACIHDPALSAAQAERLIREHGCRLLCVHSDTPNAMGIARAVGDRLRALGVHPEDKRDLA